MDRLCACVCVCVYRRHAPKIAATFAVSWVIEKLPIHRDCSKDPSSGLVVDFVVVVILAVAIVIVRQLFSLSWFGMRRWTYFTSISVNTLVEKKKTGGLCVFIGYL